MIGILFALIVSVLRWSLIGASGNFTLSFPRNHEVYISQCGEQTCFIDLYIHGWFNPDSLSFPPALPIQLSILLAHEHFINATFATLEYNLNSLSFTHRIYLTGHTALLDFQVTLIDANNQTVFEIKNENSLNLLIMSGDRYAQLNHRADPLSSLLASNHSEPTGVKAKWSDEFQKVHSNFLDFQNHHFLGKIIRQYLQRFSLLNQQESSASLKLDYIEIGTSDFDTIIQSVDRFRQQPEHYLCPSIVSAQEENCLKIGRREYYGISIDAVNGYINRLPSIPTSLKLNAAIIPQILPETNYTINMGLDWKPIYFVPDFLLDEYFPPQWTGVLRGVSELNRISAYITSSMIVTKSPVTVIQKEFIPSLTVSYLLAWTHQYYPNGVNVIKLDIEGLDVKVLNDIIHFYLHYFPVDDANDKVLHNHEANENVKKLPCLLFFETQTYIKADAQNEYELLKKMGYSLLSEHSNMSVLLKDFLLTNAIAVNCRCDADLLADSWKLMNFEVLNGLSPLDLYSNICFA